MKKVTKLRTLPKDASIDDAVERMRQEGTLIQKQYEELCSLYKDIKQSTDWTYLQEEDCEAVIENIEPVINQTKQNIEYIETQLAILEKAQTVFASDDPIAIKALAEEYLLIDLRMSLKSLALQRYDNSETIKQLYDFKQP